MFQTPEQAPLRGTGHQRQGIRFLRCHGRWRLADSRRTLCQRVGRQEAQVLVVACAHAWRTHESLGSHLAAQWSVRFQRAHSAMASVSTGHSPMRISRRTTTRWRCSSACYGNRDGLENTPDSPDGCLLPAPTPRAGELFLRKGAAKVGVPVVAIHRAVLTKQLDHKRIPALLHPGNPGAQKIIAEDMQRRAACFWATDCGRGCSIRANYQSTTVHLPPALSTGNLDIVTMPWFAR